MLRSRGSSETPPGSTIVIVIITMSICQNETMTRFVADSSLSSHFIGRAVDGEGADWPKQEVVRVSTDICKHNVHCLRCLLLTPQCFKTLHDLVSPVTLVTDHVPVYVLH